MDSCLFVAAAFILAIIGFGVALGLVFLKGILAERGYLPRFFSVFASSEARRLLMIFVGLVAGLLVLFTAIALVRHCV